MQGITPFLWLENEAEEALELYTSVFPNSKVHNLVRYGDAGPGKPGEVMTATFELNGQQFMVLNGAPGNQFNSAISFLVPCDSQEEIDATWSALLAGGGEEIQCGWLKDKFGVHWQIVPSNFGDLIGGPDAAGAARAMQAMMKMVKLDIAELQRAYDGA